MTQAAPQLPLQPAPCSCCNATHVDCTGRIEDRVCDACATALLTEAHAPQPSDMLRECIRCHVVIDVSQVHWRQQGRHAMQLPYCCGCAHGLRCPGLPEPIPEPRTR